MYQHKQKSLKKKKNPTVTSAILPKEKNVLFTSFIAVTEKQDKENQACDVFALELKLTYRRSVCPSLATFGKSSHFDGNKTVCKYFSFFFAKQG